jgi:hypothetical protein
MRGEASEQAECRHQRKPRSPEGEAQRAALFAKNAAGIAFGKNFPARAPPIVPLRSRKRLFRRSHGVDQIAARLVVEETNGV